MTLLLVLSVLRIRISVALKSTLIFVVVLMSVELQADPNMNSLALPAVWMQQAAQDGNELGLRHMVKQGVPVDLMWRAWTPLMQAVVARQHKAVGTLIELGADVNALSAKGETPLLLALVEGDYQLVSILVNAGADFELKGQKVSPLKLAIHFENPYLVEEFLAAGANPNGDGQGVAPLILATSMGKAELVKSLIQNSANINIRDKASGLTSLELSILRGDFEVFKELLLAGVRVDEVGHKGLSAHQLIVALGRRKMQKWVSSMYQELRTPKAPRLPPEFLAVAIINKQYQQVESLLKEQKDLKAVTSRKWSPLMLAIGTGDWKMFDLVFKYDRNVNASAKGGFGALHLATTRNWPYVVGELMSAGANLSLKSRRSVTPFDLARILVDQKVMKKMKPQVARKSTSDRHFVKELQSLLYLRGYKTGVPDGVRGNKTASALRFYNWALGRKVSSETSIEVLNSLWKHIDHSGAVGNLSGGFAISNVQEHMSWNYLTDGQGAAHSKAIKNCKKNARGSCNKWNVGFTKGCFAYATTGRKTWAYQVSPTIWEARRKALKACHKLKNGQCRLSIEFCSDGSFTYKRQVR